MAKLMTQSTRKHTQVRGRIRREKLVMATKSLLDEQALDEISLADIAARADIPTSSTYHFFTSPIEIFELVAIRFGEELEAAIFYPMDLENSDWLEVFNIAIDRAVEFYNKHPGYQQLIIGPKTPPEIKYSDRSHDHSVSHGLVEIVRKHFILPDIPRLDQVFFNAIEIADLMFQLSVIREGSITDEMKQDAKLALHAYLRVYFPEILPRRTDLLNEIDED